MANTIRLKKRASGGASGAPSSLAPSEPAYSEVDNILYYGFGDAGGGAASSVISIAGSGAFSTLTTAQTISGNKTYTGTLDFSGATIATFETTGNVTVGGNLTVSGTTTTVNSTTVTVDDKNLELGSVATPTDSTADGGGITLKGATDKTFNWVNTPTVGLAAKISILLLERITRSMGPAFLAVALLVLVLLAPALLLLER